MKTQDSIRCIRKYQRKDGTFSYHAEVRRKNAKPLRQSFRTLTDAKNWVRKMETSILDGKYVADNKARKYSLSELIEQYVHLHLSKHPSRLKDQIPHLNWWRTQYGEKPLLEITPSLLANARETLLNGITTRNTLRSNSTVNRYFATLSKAFSLASREWELIADNPFRRIAKLKENAGRNRFLTRNELQTLLAKCKESKNHNLYGMVLIAASMGLRFSETVNLRWKHIDFANGFVTLERTKNGDTRFVPLPDHVTSYLKEKNSSPLPEDFIFPSKNPNHRYPYSLIRKSFQKALEAADIKEFRYHDLRHTCASHLAMNGATQSELMEILGHRSPILTRRYAHFTKEHLSRLVQRTSTNLITPQGSLHDNPPSHTAKTPT